MPPPVVRMVLLPRFTGLSGETDFLTPPLNVRAFSAALITVWKSHGLGDPEAEVEFQMQESTDLVDWNDIDSSFTPSAAETEVTVARSLKFEWVRLKATVSTTGLYPCITVWGVGAFLPRRRAGSED